MPLPHPVLASAVDSSPQVAWEDIDGRQCLVVTFSGKLTRADAASAMDIIRAEVEGAAEPVVMVWEATAMSGYESEARTLWQEGLAELKPGIQAIHLVSESAVIRMGAAVVGMFVGYPITSWSSRADVRLRD